jgi:CheY-like chemotaxis protein
MPFQILIVDDNAMNLSLLEKILALDGYQVITAQSGQQALELVAQHAPDLAILDIMMPGMDGFSLCKALRQPPIQATFPIVLLSAMNQETAAARAGEAGATAVWSKPFDMAVFQQETRTLLDGRAPSAP